ncbi:hypothetical protein HS9_03241 [Bacillus velezensis]|nr:hypothetical protein HS9_03241 [Bacillus velezensis]
MYCYFLLREMRTLHITIADIKSFMNSKAGTKRPHTLSHNPVFQYIVCQTKKAPYHYGKNAF